MKNASQLFIKAAVTVAIVSMLAACAGQSSDPLKEYKDVKKGPINKEVSPTQTMEVEKFAVETVGTNEKNYGNFIEGKQGELSIRIIPKVANIEAPKFEILNFPSANQPQVVRSSNDTYKLVWTPSAGTIPQGQTQSEINFQVNVSANGQVQEVKTLFLVSRTNLIPKISGTSGLEVKAEEGQTIPFTVDIQDPNFNGNGVPEVIISPYMNTNIEAFMANGSTFVFQNYKQKQNPVQMGENTFRFYYEMKLDKLPDLLDRKGNVDPNAASVQLCFNLRALSVVETASTTVQHCVEAKYSAQPAQVAFDSAERKVKAGESNVIKFNISTANSTSVLNVNDAKKQIENLAGDKALDCKADNDKKTSVKCELAWTPVCSSKALSKNATNLRLKVDSVLNNKAKVTNVNEQFEVDNSACEAQALAKAEAAKKAAEEKAAADKKAKDEKAAVKAAAAQKKVEAKAEANKKAQEKAAAKATQKSKSSTATKAVAEKASADQKPKAKSSAEIKS